MKGAITFGLLALFPGFSASAHEQSQLTLSERCEARVIAAVEEQIGQGDETFSVESIKLLYGGSIGGSHYSPVVLVKTSDETEPRDILVTAKVEGDRHASRTGCRIVSVHTLADGSTVDMPGMKDVSNR